MKKMLSLLSALALCLGLWAFPASAAGGDFTIEDGVLTKYNGPGGDVVIPDGVTSIGVSAFEDCTSLTSITIPSSVTRIYDMAFYGCTSLTDATIPSSVTRIGGGAFFGSPWLESLGEFAVVNGILIRYQGSDSAVTIPSSVTRIGGSAFWRCEDLTSVIIPSSVSHIEVGAFAGCEDLTSVTIPSNVTYIGAEAFAGCTSLMDVYYTGGKAQWDAIQRDSTSFMEDLTNSAIHYTADDQQEPPTVEKAPATASPTNDALTADGVLQTPTVYKINGSNYFKIRDLAAILNGTEKQFSVGYDSELKSVTATTGEGYEKQEGDLAGAPAGGEKTAEPSNDAIYINGEKVEAEVYKIDGSNYFKLRDLGKALDFYVGYSAETGVFLETDKPYSE